MDKALFQPQNGFALAAQISEGDVNDFLGDMDLFLLDQVLKAGFGPPGDLLDVGFGSGRNLVFFLNTGWRIWGIDSDKGHVELLRYLLGQQPDQDPNRIVTGSVESLPWKAQQFDLVICSRVLHFLSSVESILTSCRGMHQVLKSGGVLYLSMNSAINFESHLFAEGAVSVFRDGTKGIFLDEPSAKAVVDIGFEKVMPNRTVHFDDQHAETTMILRKL